MVDATSARGVNRGDRPAMHSDRGRPHRWRGWLSRVEGTQLVRSMSRKACSADNAACECLFGRLTNQLFYSHDRLSTTIEKLVGALDTYTHWYDEARAMVSLTSCKPVEHRRRLGIAV